MNEVSGNRVLVVDDEPGLVHALAINLRAHGWDVSTAADGAGALDLAASAHPDVVVLDLGLPDISGLDVIAGIRGWSRVPIVVLSARQHGEDKVDAHDAGADDYVTKPFAMNELLARLRAAVRRAAPGDVTEAVVEAGELRIDLARRQVQRLGVEVRLSPTEWAMIEVLVRNRGKLRRTAPAPAGGLGTLLRDGDRLPARLRGPVQAQARARSGPPPSPHHRARHGLRLRDDPPKAPAPHPDLADAGRRIRPRTASCR
jgi:two-component system KDP operon response regulator KdpE